MCVEGNTIGRGHIRCTSIMEVDEYVNGGLNFQLKCCLLLKFMILMNNKVTSL